jgi:zinc protease
MSFKRQIALLLALALSSPILMAQRRSGAQSKQKATPKTNNAVLPPIKYEEFTLPNGLRVILHEDHSTPIVAVNIWYHVGSKNEVPGRTGFAHLFEHMMFQGSKHHDDEYFQPLQEAGGTLNGSTNADRTNYWEVVPSNFLELALWLESDRMGYLLDVLTDDKLNNQRDVVKNEKRQNYDNRPYGLVGARIAELMYPPEHPYHWLTIGSLDDLTAASKEDVSDFFRRFYTPNNASLVIAGDINPAEARGLAEKYFGPLKRGPEVTRPNPPQPQLDKEMRVTMQDRVTLPRIYMAWHSVPQFTSNEAALDTVANILAGGKSSRLYKSLVYEKQIAQDVSAFNNSREVAGQFQITATAKPGISLEQLESTINAEIAKLKTDGPTPEEMDRSYNARESSFIYGMQTVGGFGGKSDQLNQYATFLNQPNHFDMDLIRYRNVKADDVRRVANDFLTEKRLVLTVTPAPRNKRSSGEPTATAPATAMPNPSQQTGASPATTTTTPAQPSRAGAAAQTAAQAQAAGAQAQNRGVADASMPAGATPPTTAASGRGNLRHEDLSNRRGLYAQPKPKPDPKFTLPQIQHRKLSNGLEVMIVEQRELPVVQLGLVIKTGSAADPQGKPGLASLTAAMIDEGTKTRNALDISNQLAQIGSRLTSASDFDSSDVDLLTLTKHLDRALDIFADVLTSPTFPDSELELQRKQRLTALLQRKDNADAIAGVVYPAVLYGKDHPYGHSIVGDEKSVGAISVNDVKEFYQTYYRPNNATLIVVGDVTPETIMPKLEKALAGWKPAPVPGVEIGAAPARQSAAIYLVDRPGAAQSVINIGQVGVPRSSPDFFPLLVLNTLLGGQFTSRVNMNLREDKGYTYGARTVFDFRRAPGPFVASAGVQTAVTKESVFEFMKELRGVRGPIPVTEQELEFAKQAIIRGYPRTFETPEQIAGRLSTVALYGLPDSYFNTYIQNIRSVKLADVNRVANRYLDPSRMAILIVGDRKVIEPGLRSLSDLGSTITVLDSEGRPAGPSGEGGTLQR